MRTNVLVRRRFNSGFGLSLLLLPLCRRSSLLTLLLAAGCTTLSQMPPEHARIAKGLTALLNQGGPIGEDEISQAFGFNVLLLPDVCQAQPDRCGASELSDRTADPWGPSQGVPAHVPGTPLKRVEIDRPAHRLKGFDTITLQRVLLVFAEGSCVTAEEVKTISRTGYTATPARTHADISAAVPSPASVVFGQPGRTTSLSLRDDCSSSAELTFIVPMPP